MLEKQAIMEKINCPICKRSNQNTILISRKDDISEKIFNIVQCDCGFKFLNPRPTSLEINKYYDVDTYHPHQKGHGIIYYLFNVARKFTYFWKLNLISKYSDGKIKHLDYGGGDGSFSKYVKKSDNQSISYDPITNNIQDFINQNQKFNIITLWHSLEHIHDLDNLFSNLDKLSDINARVIIAVPNFNAFEKKYFGDEWAAFDLPRHLYHFDHIALTKLLDNKKYNIINKKNIFLDTIYISLLSKNKSEDISFFKMLKIIIKTIIRVIYNGPNFSSSLLFICEKRN